MIAKTSTNQFKRPDQIPRLRANPFAADGFDPLRADYQRYLWASQDDLLRQRDRTVEECIRLLHGQHWIVWSNLRGRYINLAEHLSDDERRWRHMPVLNRLMLWFILTHARMTENPPVISWNAGPDRIDQLLCEVADPLFKHLWRDVGMPDVIDRLFSWMIPSGRAYLESLIDPFKGDPIPQQGPAKLRLLDQFGNPQMGEDNQPIEREFPDVPFRRDDSSGDFVPAVEARFDEGTNDYAIKPIEGDHGTGQPMYKGGIEVDVLTCLEVRGEWGQNRPWHKKAWHMKKVLLTPLQVWERWGIELEPDVMGQEAETTGTLWRMLHGSGLFGAAEGRRGSDMAANQEFCTIFEGYYRPGRLQGTERSQQSPGGRLLITTGSGKVIRDGVLPARFRYTSPIRAFDFVGLPAREQGTSPQEFLNGPVRTRNRLFAQKVQHATLAANPIRVVDRSQGLEQGQVTNTPGSEVLADRSRSKAPPVEYVRVADLGKDVDEAAGQLKQEIDEMGSIAGGQGTPPTDDPSGELVKELRFNADRPIAATMKRAVTEFARMAEDWLALAEVVYDEEEIISFTGEDNVARTITVFPMLFQQGSAHAEPEVESMLPEGRGERQAKAHQLWQDGAWGDPASPQAREMYLDQARFPHMARMTRPGGADRATAEQNVGLLLQGTPANQIPIYPWYDFVIFLYVTEQYLKSPEFKKLDPARQQQCVTYWTALKSGQAEAAVLEETRALEAKTAVATANIRAQSELQGVALAHGIAPGAGAPSSSSPAENTPASPASPPAGTASAGAAA